jgi:hypothetical protein
MNKASINAPKKAGGDLKGGSQNQYGENRHIAGAGGGNKATNKGKGRAHP